MKFQFGDIVENGWASETNPLRRGIFVRDCGRTWEFTDGQGGFWETLKHNEKLRKVGSVLDPEAMRKETV